MQLNLSYTRYLAGMLGNILEVSAKIPKLVLVFQQVMMQLKDRKLMLITELRYSSRHLPAQS